MLEEKTLITGRRMKIPSDWNMVSNGKYENIPSYQLTYVRNDGIIALRPDMTVTIM